AISFLKTDNGYVLYEYWTPRDGSYYAKDIKANFPKDIVKEGLDSQKYVLSQEQENYSEAVRVLNVDTYPVIERLFDLVVSNGAAVFSSNPKDYIDSGDLYIRELLYYGQYTFEYVVKEFYKGGRYDLKGHIMRYVLDGIIGGEAIKTHAETGQEYFDAWIKHNERILDLNGEEFMIKHYPYGYTALLMKNS
ncbi:MAG: hypothetical protein IJS65_06090, partial [Clostridia bacterium]|nr:hypothetical protein [Clostridia bacterium]